MVVEEHEKGGKEASPSAGVIDSQSVKITENGGPRGWSREPLHGLAGVAGSLKISSLFHRKFYNAAIPRLHRTPSQTHRLIIESDS